MKPSNPNRSSEWELPGGTDVKATELGRTATTEALNNEVQQETGIIYSGEFVEIPQLIEGKVQFVPDTHLVVGGSGTDLEIESYPYLLRYSEIESIPELKLSNEHTDYVFLYFEGWGDNDRDQLRMLQKQFGRRSEHDPFVLKLRNAGERLYQFVEPEDSNLGIKVSDVTGLALAGYFSASFHRLIDTPEEKGKPLSELRK